MLSDNREMVNNSYSAVRWGTWEKRSYIVRGYWGTHRPCSRTGGGENKIGEDIRAAVGEQGRILL